MNELKIFVERCVRPVVVEESAKLRMRRELYAHANEAYGQELARTENAEVALQRTLERMGDPKQLTADLQDSIGTLERWTGHVDVLMNRPAEMSLCWYALRVTFFFGGPFVALLLLVLAFRLPELLVGSSWARAELRFIGSLGLVWVANLFTYSLLYGKAFGVLELESWTPGRVAAVAMLAVTAAIDALASGWLLMFFACGSVDFTQQVLPYWGPLAAIGAVAIVVVSWLGVSQLRGLKEWRELEIEG